MRIARRDIWRFRLRSLMILVTIAAVGLSAWIWRARARVQVARQLADEGIGVLSVSDAPRFVPGSVRRDIPFARPALAELYVDIAVDGRIFLDEQQLALDDATRKLDEKRDRVRAAGIKIIHLLFVAHETTVARLMKSTDGRETLIALMKYAERSGFASTGTLDSNQVNERKKNLDPTGIVSAK